MLTDAQVQVLAALNDRLDIWGVADIDPNEEMPGYLRDLGLTDHEIHQALADLLELALIQGLTVAEWDFPLRVTGVTARGRQELP